MQQALAEAKKAAAAGEVPVGAVLVAPNGAVIATAANRTRRDGDPTAHAELLAIRAAAARLGKERLDGCAWWVTLEPCAMCAGAISLARVPRLVDGATDPKGGAAGGVIDLYGDPSSAVLNHHPQVESGLLSEESKALLEGFFAARR
jgi:tRNA(adenine34) deaminase